MTRILSLILASATISNAALAQDRYMTRTGHVEFHSSTSMEDIHADNDKVTSVWDVTTGVVEFAVLIKAFTFEKALMQEHFNENYMESNTFPKANFKGNVKGVSAEHLKTPGTYPVAVEGKITIHGVEQTLITKGTVTVDAKGGIRAESGFAVRPADHDIKIPGAVRKNIAEEIQVKVRLDYTRM